MNKNIFFLIALLSSSFIFASGHEVKPLSTKSATLKQQCEGNHGGGSGAAAAPIASAAPVGVQAVQNPYPYAACLLAAVSKISFFKRPAMQAINPKKWDEEDDAHETIFKSIKKHLPLFAATDAHETLVGINDLCDPTKDEIQDPARIEGFFTAGANPLVRFKSAILQIDPSLSKAYAVIDAAQAKKAAAQVLAAKPAASPVAASTSAPQPTAAPMTAAAVAKAPTQSAAGTPAKAPKPVGVMFTNTGQAAVLPSKFE